MYGWENAQSALGILFVIAVCWGLSEDKKRFPWKLTLGAIAVQAGLVWLLFGFPASQSVLDAINAGVDGLSAATHKGAQFVFGYLAGGPQPYALQDQGALFVFAFEVLPLILVISALSALLWHWKILKWITQAFGFLFEKTMGLGGASALSVAANIFLGMIESQIVIRAYLDKLTRSELFLQMVVGLATVAGSTMVAYAAILKDTPPNAAGHVLVASIISAPAGVMLARIMVPEKPGHGKDFDEGEVELQYDSSIDAIVKGTADGLSVVLNISAVLIVFVALVALANVIMGGFWWDGPITVERILGYVFTPLAWLIGLPWSEARIGGQLLGVKLVLTEFVAFIDLGKIPAGELSERSRMLLTYALCGFANIASVGITVTGFSVLMPNRRTEVMNMVWKSLVAGFLATCLTASIVGLMPPSLFGG